MERIFCISAGQLIVKKSDTVINRKNRYLNYGLLSLATTLKKDGWNTLQIQGLFDTPQTTINKCIENGFNKSSTLPLLISIPSFYAVSWVNSFIALLKNINKNIKVIIGGRWVISESPDLMKELIPQSDIITKGLADNTISRIVESCFPTGITKVNIKSNTYNDLPLDYSLLHDRHLYQPSIEISRGCGMGCSFCQEKDEKLSLLKDPELIINEAKSILLSDNLNQMNIYFEASMFIPIKSWIKGLIAAREKHEIKFHWRAESRVDSINVRLVKDLALSGLKVLDLGLESASKIQLSRMNKAKNPEIYLKRTSLLLKECHKYKILVKINILLFAGETNQTISETIKWLRQHKEYIKGVSVGPVIVFGWEKDTKQYIKELESYGATKSHTPTIGVQYLNLSQQINYDKSIDISKSISNEFMSTLDYFELKSFSYFSRDYRYEQYKKDLTNNIQSEKLKNKAIK